MLNRIKDTVENTRLHVLYNTYLRKILKIRWPDKFSNDKLDKEQSSYPLKKTL
ncbi:hypothetical protein DPMN_133365 [Dreissena polymorpha]|uniref:Uncharacterized protein n=1 Tax=Dreissena polymorpha TaxID=45954 RepID=A0A9D4JDX5_DREPO|nr:hypothetical protein DPMN_133365 [Dreissena polymorpha]